MEIKDFYDFITMNKINYFHIERAADDSDDIIIELLFDQLHIFAKLLSSPIFYVWGINIKLLKDSVQISLLDLFRYYDIDMADLVSLLDSNKGEWNDLQMDT